MERLDADEAQIVAEEEKQRMRQTPEYGMIVGTVKKVGDTLMDFLASSDLPVTPSVVAAYVKSIRDELPFFEFSDDIMCQMLRAYLTDSIEKSRASADRLEEAMRALAPSEHMERAA